MLTLTPPPSTGPLRSKGTAPAAPCHFIHPPPGLRLRKELKRGLSQHTAVVVRRQPGPSPPPLLKPLEEVFPGGAGDSEDPGVGLQAPRGFVRRPRLNERAERWPSHPGRISGHAAGARRRRGGQERTTPECWPGPRKARPDPDAENMHGTSSGLLTPVPKRRRNTTFVLMGLGLLYWVAFLKEGPRFYFGQPNTELDCESGACKTGYEWRRVGGDVSSTLGLQFGAAPWGTQT